MSNDIIKSLNAANNAKDKTIREMQEEIKMLKNNDNKALLKKINELETRLTKGHELFAKMQEEMEVKNAQIRALKQALENQIKDAPNKPKKVFVERPNSGVKCGNCSNRDNEVHHASTKEVKACYANR